MGKQKFIVLQIALFLTMCTATVLPQTTKSHVVPTVITNHYDKSEIESHGVVVVKRAEETIKVEVKDLTKNAEYDVMLLNEMSGKRSKLGTLKTNGKGFASVDYSVKGLYPTFNALLIVNGEDVVQYAQLVESSHGCICKHSGGSIVTNKLDQECYECPCGVNFEICCGGKK